MTQAGLEPAVPVTPCALQFLTGDGTRIVSGYQRSYTATCSGGRVATLTTHRSQFNKLTSWITIMLLLAVSMTQTRVTASCELAELPTDWLTLLH